MSAILSFFGPSLVTYNICIAQTITTEENFWWSISTKSHFHEDCNCQTYHIHDERGSQWQRELSQVDSIRGQGLDLDPHLSAQS